MARIGLVQQAFRRRDGVQLAVRDGLDRRLPRRGLAGAPRREVGEGSPDLAGGPLPRGERLAGDRPMRLDRVGEGGHAIIGRGCGDEHRRWLALDAAAGRREHGPQLARGAVRAGPVGLVDDDDVGDLEQAGLDGLHLVAPSRAPRRRPWSRPGAPPRPRTGPRRPSRRGPDRSPAASSSARRRARSSRPGPPSCAAATPSSG